ncbi:hypothetical protein JSO54_06410 [Riemerella anatipestifer]|uniref:hypothetical protein n=1 Tax=Riemerella anatipestifer TaxID=34085 RepID=UPI001374D4DB|nr:hypothetical protein [Riemerella anatipestifer]
MEIWDKNRYKKDLSLFKEILDSEKEIEGDFKSISDTIDEMDRKDIVEYDIKNLCFYINGRIAGSVPDNLNYCQIFFDNKIALKDCLNENYDPFHIYALNINIHLYKGKKDTRKAYCSSWHLDKEDKEVTFKYSHPYYHFQFGGKKFEYLDSEMGLLSCPRIPHPPMDIFLGFHFILNNFYNKKQFKFINRIIENPDYKIIIKRAQERLWTPYFKAFDSSNNHNDFKIEKIFPLYIL